MRTNELPEETETQVRDKINCYQAEHWHINSQIEALKHMQKNNNAAMDLLFLRLYNMIMRRNEPGAAEGKSNG